MEEEDEGEAVGFEQTKIEKIKTSSHLQITAANKAHVNGSSPLLYNLYYKFLINSSFLPFIYS